MARARQSLERVLKSPNAKAGDWRVSPEGESPQAESPGPAPSSVLRVTHSMILFVDSPAKPRPGPVYRPARAIFFESISF